MIYNPKSLVLLGKKDLKKALNVMVEAFINYPFPKNIIKDEDNRKVVLKELFKIQLKYSFKKGYVFSLGRDFKEIAVLHGDCLSRRFLAYIPFISLSSINLITKISGRESKKLSVFVEDIMKAKKNLDLPDNTIELTYLAVEPCHQGEGRASRLLDAISDNIDNQDTHCLLMTNTRRNKDMYVRKGYKVINHFYDRINEIDNYFMLR